MATPLYYVNNFPTVTDDLSDNDLSDVEKVLTGSGAKDLYSALSKVLKELDKPTTLNFLIKNVASEFVGQAFEIAFDPVTEQFEIDGEAITGVVGKTATDKAVTAILTALGVGTGIVGVAARYLIWDALSETTEAEAIASFIGEVIRSARGAVPIDVQIVDTNGNVLGGALFEEDVDQAAEFEAIKELLSRTLLTSFPDISIGRDQIKVVEQTIFSPQERRYKVYDGRFVNAISEELGIIKEDLLGLGQENSPNINSQIYYSYEAPTLKKSFVFASDEHRFFVPLPDTTGGVSPVGLHPGNIISGSGGDDTLDAFQDRDPDLLFNKQNVLLLGLEGNDIINGNVENDIIVGGKGNDTIDGGFGEDVVIFSDRFKNYDYSILEDGTISFSHMRGTRKDGVDKLRNIEFVRFKDQTVALPLDRETLLNLEESKDDVTFRFEATVAESKYIHYSGTLYPGGTAIPLVLEYSFDPKVPDLNPRMDGRYFPIYGVLTLGSQSTSIKNGTLNVDFDNDESYSLTFNGDSNATRNPSGGSLFGLDLKYLQFNLVDKDRDLYDDSQPNTIPTNADFAQRADTYSISVFLQKGQLGIDRDYRSMSLQGFTKLFPSFTLESDGDKNTNGNPIAVDDEFSALANTVVSFPILDLLENDSDPDEDALVFDGVDNLVNGTIQIINNNINFIPSDGFTGLASFNYTVSDGYGGSDTATVTINFTASNEVPVAINDSFQIDEDDLLVGNVLLNDSDVDGNELVVTLLTDAKYGSLTLNSDGSFLYFPNNNFNGTDSFTYGLSDGAFTDTATVTLIVEPINDAPAALPDSVSTLQDTPIIINIIENDSDVDGDALAVSNVGTAANGSISQNSDSTITYIPNAGFTGNDSFSYTLSDSNGETATAIVSIVVDTTPTPIPTPTPEPSTLPSLARIADDIFSVSGGTANKPKLQITILDSSPSSVNELAVFTVDDAQGRINGIAPTETAYTQAAISRAKVIFSMIANAPQGFDPKSLSRSLEFNSDDSLRFLLTKNDTLDSVRNENPSNPDILFSNASNQRITASSTGGFTLAWEDGNGNSSDFKDFVVNIQVTDTPLPLGANLQDQQQGEVLDLSGVDLTKTVQANFAVSREAAYNNSVGFYKVIDYQGTITEPLAGISLKPGDLGYVEAAIKNRVAGIDLQAPNQSTVTINGVFQGGSIFAPFIIANGSADQLLDADKSNDPSVYFAYSGANAGRVDHIRLLGNNVFGFEDLPRGGDFDYNDMIIKADLSVI